MTTVMLTSLGKALGVNNTKNILRFCVLIVKLKGRALHVLDQLEMIKTKNVTTVSLQRLVEVHSQTSTPFIFVVFIGDLPCTVKDRKVEDGLLLATVHMYVPGCLPLTVRVCVYCAVTALFNTVSVPSVTVMESLVQVTVVAGPPVEIQVRVN